MKIISTCFFACFFLFSSAQDILLDSITYFSLDENAVVNRQIFEYDADQNITANHQLYDSPDYNSYRNQYFKYKSGNILDTVITNINDLFFDEGLLPPPSQAVIRYPTSDSIVLEGIYLDENGLLYFSSSQRQKYNPNGKIVSEVFELKEDGFSNYFVFNNTFYYYSDNDRIDSILFFQYSPFSNELFKWRVWHYDYEDSLLTEIIKLEITDDHEYFPYEKTLYSAFQGGLYGKKEHFIYDTYDDVMIDHSIDSFIFDNKDRVASIYSDYYHNGQMAYRGLIKLEYIDDFLVVKSLDGLNFFNKIVNPSAQKEFEPEHFDIVGHKFKSVESFIWDRDSETYSQQGIINFFYSDLPSKVEGIIANNILTIFPNPVADFLNIEGIEKIELATYWIYGMDGQILMSQKLSTNNIDVTTLNAGAYLLRIQTNTTDDAAFKRFIKI